MSQNRSRGNSQVGHGDYHKPRSRLTSIDGGFKPRSRAQSRVGGGSRHLDDDLPRSRTNSQIIQAFTQAKQELQLEENKRQIAKTTSTKQPEVQSKDDKPKEKKKGLDVSEKYKSMDEHKIELKELYERLGVDPAQGLTNDQAHAKNLELGDNMLSGKKKTPWYIMLIKELTTFFAILLWIGGILSIVAYVLSPTDPSNLYLGIVLFIVNLLTGVVTYTQNAKSEAIVETFKNMIPPKTKVLRGGNYTVIEATKLVPGDIVEVKGGDRIPADLRIIYSQEMRVDNSSLTGESDPLLRTLECTNKENPLETDNLAFFGTLCKEGIGRGVIIQIGDNTVIGQIANLASEAGTSKTPLRTEIDRFIIIISAIAIFSGIIFFVLGFVLGYSVIQNIIFAIGIIVANVPEGLLATVTAALTITAKRLSVKKVLVKNLEAVETLGSTSCICSDKTGTLTQNKMTVEHMWYGGKIVKALNYQKFGGPSYNFEYNINSSGFKALQENAMVCSEAVFDMYDDSEEEEEEVSPQNTKQVKDIQKPLLGEQPKQKNNNKGGDYDEEEKVTLWLDAQAIGDASESALIKFFQPIEDIIETRNRYPVRALNDGSLAKIPFNSAWKYALNIVDYKTHDSVNCTFIKGAPEKIWQLCSHILINDQVHPIDDHWQREFLRVNRVFGEGGERVLGFAKMHLPKHQFPEDYQFTCKNVRDHNYPMKGFVFTGLVSLVDPPREAVPFSVLKCKTAGIKVIMVTGDQPVTAAAIARQVNIFDKNEKTVNQVAEEQGISFDAAFHKADAIVIHGDLITEAMKADEDLPEEQQGKTLARWLEKPRIVFARTTPAQKLIIVKGCQEQGHIVAVTGDGVNDSPAIKKADIGIAMGITGSDVAKDAADMVLLSDDFAAIILGIEEGRRIFDNLKKSIVYALTANIPELIPFLAFFIVRFPLPISTFLMLCICIGTDIIPAISFASEEAELGIMVRPPRKKTEHMVTKKLMTAAYGMFGIFETLGGFLVYFVIMKDFGFPTEQLFGLATTVGFTPSAGDVYNADAPFYGQTSQAFINYCQNCWSGNGCNIENTSAAAPDWLYNNNKDTDLRLFYLRCGTENGNNYIYNAVEFSQCIVKQISPISGIPVCFTPDALKYAQTGFFFGIVFGQISNALNCKTRRHSMIFSGLRNYVLIFGFTTETALCLILAYGSPLNSALNTRPVYFLHFGLQAITVSVYALIFEETRKFLLRNMKPNSPPKPNWLERNTYW